MARSSGIIRYALSLLRRDTSGAVAVITAISFTSLLGVAGLATEASFWYVKKRDMQGAVDSAAYSATAALLAGETGGPSGTATGLATAIAAQYGFSSGVTINNPPLSGSYAGNANAYEVIITQSQNPLLSAQFIPAVGITARAVALEQNSGSGNGCVLALDQGNVMDVSDSGTNVLNIQNCSLYVNSSSTNNALNMSGTAQINAYAAYVVGGDNISGSAQLNASNGTHLDTGAPISDPYAGTPIPSLGACASGGTISGVNKTTPLTPGTYCGGINVSGVNNTINLAPGVYIMDGGSFNISGANTINGTGVTIILTGTGSYATANISGSSTVNISAPTSGPYSGLAFYQDPRAPVGGTNSFSGGNNMNINGAIYFPDQTVNYSGGVATGATAAQCTQLIANTISISGTTNFHSNCTNAGTKTIGGTTSAQLVE